MSNFFRRGLCAILTTGLFLGSCSSLNYEGGSSVAQKPVAETKETLLKLAPSPKDTTPLQSSYDLMVKSPASLDRSNLYLIKTTSFDENKLLNYKDLFMPESNYLIREEENKVTRAQARYQLLKSFGLENTILSGRLYGNSFFDANLHIDFLKLDDLVNPSSDRRGILNSFDIGLNFKF